VLVVAVVVVAVSLHTRLVVFERVHHAPKKGFTLGRRMERRACIAFHGQLLPLALSMLTDLPWIPTIF